MSTPRFARGSKSRLFLYIGAITLTGVIIYLFLRARGELYDYQKKAEKCLQQQESLSAQFQVIIEYKVRLEKSLQQEKAEHRRLREELQGKLDNEKQQREKDNLENMNKLSSLQQQLKILQNHHEDLTEDCSRLRKTQLETMDTQTKLESALEASKKNLKEVQKAKEKEMQDLKNSYLRLEVENDKLRKQNKELTENGKDHNSNMNHLEKEVIQLNNALQALQGELSRCEAHRKNDEQSVGMGNILKAPSSISKPTSSSVAAAHDLRADVLQQPQHEHLLEKVSSSPQKSSTPQINPDALLSREKVVNPNGPLPMAMAVASPNSPGKEPTPSGSAGSSRKEQQQAAAEAAAVGAAPPAARAAEAEAAAEALDGEGEGEGEGQGALQAPNWANLNGIPNQAPFHALGGGGGGDGFVHGQQSVGGAAPVLRPLNGFAHGRAHAHANAHANAHAHGLPAGVVPAPLGYGLNAPAPPPQVPGRSQEEAAAPDTWHWGQKAWAGQGQAMAPVGEAPEHRPMGEPRHVAQGVHDSLLRPQGANEEKEKEVAQPQHHPYAEYNGENRDNGEYDKDRHGDLQLEEGEEEEDDDMDQIDYANDNGNAADARQKHLKVLKDSLPNNVNKHDSIMVNPK